MVPQSKPEAGVIQQRPSCSGLKPAFTSSPLRFDRKNVPRYNMLTVTTDPDLNRNERFRTPLRANYMGMKCLGLPRTALEADFLVSEPNSNNRRWPGVMLRIKNVLGVALSTTYGLLKPRYKKRHSSVDLLPGCSRVSISSCERGVAVTVAVHCSTPATFQAFTSDLLCAQDFCKLFARCDLPSSDLLSVDDS